ncbi:hypothetical protein WJX74_009857 [Apatococcus lobatus]|uniref:Pentatricopeptide repeat-containing protein, chloroplastic n=1 Tax=Apatococcus lobatus TaxID=904363 RepID=A0AAW1QIJ3_9CHLO
MQLVDSILLPQPWLQKSFPIHERGSCRSPAQLGVCSSPTRCRQGRTDRPPLASKSLSEASELKATAANQNPLDPGSIAPAVPSAGKLALLETRLDTLKAASQKKGVQDVFARMESRKKESNRDVQWSYLAGDGANNSPFTADYNWKEAPSTFTSHLTEQIMRMFKAYGGGNQSSEAAKQLAADLLWLLPPAGEPSSQQEALRTVERPHRGAAQQLQLGNARLSQWEVMLLLKLVAKSMGAATATSLHAFMEASGRGYDLLTLDTFNILLQAWASSPAPDENTTAFASCVKILDRMDRLEIVPDVRSYEFTISAASRDGDVASCHEVLQRALDAGVMPDAVLMGRVLFSHARCKDWHGAWATFRWMYAIGVKPVSFSFKPLLSSLAQHDRAEEIEQVLEIMETEGVELDDDICRVLLSVYSRAGRTGKALEVMEVMKKLGLRVDLSFATWLTSTMLQASGVYVSRYSSAKDHEGVLSVWKGLRTLDLISVNIDSRVAARQGMSLVRWATSLMCVLGSANEHEEVWTLFEWFKGSRLADERLLHNAMVNMAGSSNVERMQELRQLMINTEGAGALQYHGWLHWPVIAAAYKARLADLMWQEVDFAFRSFSHVPRRAAGFLSELLHHIDPADERLAEELMSQSQRWGVVANWHIATALLDIYVANGNPEKSLSFLKRTTDMAVKKTQYPVLAQAYGLVAKMCCHNERQHAALCSLAAIVPSPKTTTSFKLARVACLAHHGKIEEGMAILEEMRQDYRDQREDVTLSNIVDRMGGWYLESARIYASWASMQLEQVGERPSQITCKVAQQRQGEGAIWDSLANVFEYELSKPPHEAYTVLLEACAREHKADVASELLQWANEDGIEPSTCDLLSLLVSQPARNQPYLARKILKDQQQSITEAELLHAMHRCRSLPKPCWDDVVQEAAVWKAEGQSMRDMVLSGRPLLEEAAACLSILAPAAELQNSQGLLLAYLHFCADCGDWQSAVIMLRKHLLEAASGNTACEEAFETTFGILTRAGQWAAQVDLFKFGQEQGVLRPKPAGLELAGDLHLETLAPFTAYTTFLAWLSLLNGNCAAVSKIKESEAPFRIFTGDTITAQAAIAAFLQSQEPPLPLGMEDGAIAVSVAELAMWLEAISLPM